MRPIIINLTTKDDTGRKIMLGAVFLLIGLITVITLSNIYEYYSNSIIFDEYQKRLAAVRRHNKEMERGRARISSGEQEAIGKARQLQPILEKHFFSIPEVLTELENLKPEKLKFDEINCLVSDGTYSISIGGSSHSTEAVFQFLDKLNNSPKFTHTLSQEKMTDKRNLEFKLTAEWRHETKQ